MKIAKRMMKKCEDTGEDFWFALLHWRNVPNKIGSSPAARLFSRSTRCSVPSSVANLLPKVVEDVPEAIEKQRKRSKFHYDARSRNLPELQVGSPVFAQLNPEETKIWTPGVISNKLSDRSYLVNVAGAEYRRSLVHLKPRHGNNVDSTGSSPRLNQQLFNGSDLATATNSTVVSPTPGEIENLPESYHADVNTPPPAIQPSSTSVTVPEVTSDQPSDTATRVHDPKQRVGRPFEQAVTPSSPRTRPRRETRMPQKLKDYVLSSK